MGRNSRRLPIKFSFILPIVQIALALFLLRGPEPPNNFDTLTVSTPRLLCAGINAPATVFIALAGLFDRVDRPIPTFLGFSFAYEFFLVGILVLWYLAGTILDRWLRGDTISKWTTFRLTIALLPVVLLGLVLLIEAYEGFSSPGRWNNQFGNMLRSLFTLVWSMILLIWSGFKLAARVRANAAIVSPD